MTSIEPRAKDLLHAWESTKYPLLEVAYDYACLEDRIKFLEKRQEYLLRELEARHWGEE